MSAFYTVWTEKRRLVLPANIANNNDIWRFMIKSTLNVIFKMFAASNFLKKIY